MWSKRLDKRRENDTREDRLTLRKVEHKQRQADHQEREDAQLLEHDGIRAHDVRDAVGCHADPSDMAQLHNVYERCADQMSRLYTRLGGGNAKKCHSIR